MLVKLGDFKDCFRDLFLACVIFASCNFLIDGVVFTVSDKHYQSVNDNQASNSA